jgi:outer membrane protein assembly factor BamB
LNGLKFKATRLLHAFRLGPAPEASDVLWKKTIPGVQSYITAFNNKVFVTTTSDVLALDKNTGNTIWNTTLPALGRWAAVYKIDETHLVAGRYCLDVETGKVLWESANFSALATFFTRCLRSRGKNVLYQR